MARLAEVQASLEAKFQALFPHLDERQRGLLMGAEARSLGHGGIRVVARAAGVREGTVSRGVAELESGEAPLGRVRRAGGGRKRLVDLDPALRAALLALVEPDMQLVLGEGPGAFGPAVSARLRTHDRPTWRKHGRHEGFRIVGSQALRVRQDNRRWSRALVPKVGWVKFKRSRDLPDCKSYRVTRTGQGAGISRSPPSPNRSPHRALVRSSASTGA
jgi:hypothetical protein